MSQIRSIWAATDAARKPRASLRAALGFTLLLGVVVSGCAGPRYAGNPRPDAVSAAASVSASAIFAPTTDAALELERLPKSATAAIALRRAFLELELGRTHAAIDATSQVLYGEARPAANEESFARYLRGLCYIRRGTPELATYDLERAQKLALDPRLRELLAAVEVVPPAPRGAVGTVGILGRDQWRAVNPIGQRLDAMDRPTRITVHHSAMYFRDQTPASAAVQLQLIQREHMQGRGYGDIGYHYLIDPAGRVWQGRDMRWQGAHASGSNNVRNIGVCLLGNFIRGGQGQQPTPRQVESLRGLMAALMRDHGIQADAIHRHSDFKATECPGPLLAPIVGRLARELSGPASHVVARQTPDP